jgi:nucleoside recognition membrane protein YjiH
MRAFHFCKSIMKERVSMGNWWNMITGESGKTCLIVTMSTTNPISADPGSNQILSSKRPATNSQIHEMT